MILVGGGSRSGKTKFALDVARRRGGRLAYVATAELLDDEMHERAENHRQERGDGFVTIEEPRQLVEVIESRGSQFDAMVIDCLTLWLYNMVFSHPVEPNFRAAARHLAITAAKSQAQIIFVTNEVGCGIVPETALAREFRDHAGWLNQTVAEHATEAYLIVFGQPLKVKG